MKKCKVCGQDYIHPHQNCVSVEERLRRQELALAVFEAAFEMFDSFKQGDVGKDLVYLMGAILDHKDPDAFVDWTKDLLPESELREFMVGRFAKHHQVWKFIKL